MNNGFVVRRVSGVYKVVFSNIWGLVNQALGTKVKKRTLKGTTINGNPLVLIVATSLKKPNWPEENQLAQ